MKKPGVNASIDAIESYASDISRIVCLKLLEDRFRSILRHYGITIFNYGAGRLNIAGGPVVEHLWTSMDPRWLQRYLERGYQRIDRLVIAGMNRIAPFFFEDVFSVPPALPEQMEMETMFPYRRGYVVPMHSPFGRFGILSAVDDIADEAEWQRERFRRMSLVTLIATVTHQRVEQLSRAQPLPLTHREREVLKWVTSGKTSLEAAIILGITERTVKKHIKAAMEKTGSANRVDLVAKVLLGGVIAF